MSMPRRRTDDVVNVVMTDHYIQSKPARDLLAAVPEAQETGDLLKGEWCCCIRRVWRRPEKQLSTLPLHKSPRVRI